MVCVNCGKEFEPNPYANGRQKFCSKKCRKHWGGQHECKETFTCKHCGKAFIPKRPDRNQYCSRECAYAHKAAKPKEPKAKPVCIVCGTVFDGPPYANVCSKACRRERLKHWAHESHRRHFVSKRETNPYVEKVCPECGKVFQVNFCAERRRYCSTACANRVLNRTRERQKRVRHRQVKHEPYTLRELYLRDGGRCQLCGKRVSLRLKPPHLRAATTDHLIPYSWGGHDVRANVQLACYDCNTKKGDRKPVQLRMLEWGIASETTS